MAHSYGMQSYDKENYETRLELPHSMLTPSAMQKFEPMTTNFIHRVRIMAQGIGKPRWKAQSADLCGSLVSLFVCLVGIVSTWMLPFQVAL
jgi:hypothetical protein